ncbi:MAG TPA: sugar phosphate isomerase/epimerase [bacterium]|nr:sugar phosphate isomerase/epimerase [bacterium]
MNCRIKDTKWINCDGIKNLSKIHFLKKTENKYNMIKCNRKWKCLKKRFPFRLGTSSYIIPADILENVKALAETVDDIELVLFESDEISNLPDQKTIDELVKLTKKHDLTYTVHLPLDINLGDSVESGRLKSVEKCLRIIDIMETVKPFAYLVHCYRNNELSDSSPAEAADSWKSSVSQSLEKLIDYGITPHRICVETLNYPFEIIEDIVFDLKLSICLDIGHIFLGGYSMDSYMKRYLERTRVIHLHGIVDGKDHQNISNIDSKCLASLIERLYNDGSNNRVVTLEIFNENDFIKSMDIMERYVY